LGIDKDLADELQALLIQRGFRVNITSLRQRTAWHTKEPQTQYRVHIREQTEATIGGRRWYPSKLVKRRNQLKELPTKPGEWVWCVKTSLGTIVTRRNGKVAIVGNCGRGFRLSEGKKNCLVLDYGRNAERHGPVDEITAPPIGDEPAPDEEKDKGPRAKECPRCMTLMALNCSCCPDCGYVFPSQNKVKHGASASYAPILSTQRPQVTITEHDVREVFYCVHKKRGAPDSAPRTMRVIYRIGVFETKSEYICFEHTGYPRAKAVTWWTRRSRMPVPQTAAEAVTLAEAGYLAHTKMIKVKKVEGEKYDQIIGYELGDIPSADDQNPPAEALEFPFGANATATDGEVPW